MTTVNALSKWYSWRNTASKVWKCWIIKSKSCERYSIPMWSNVSTFTRQVHIAISSLNCVPMEIYWIIWRDGENLKRWWPYKSCIKSSRESSICWAKAFCIGIWSPLIFWIIKRFGRSLILGLPLWLREKSRLSTMWGLLSTCLWRL